MLTGGCPPHTRHMTLTAFDPRFTRDSGREIFGGSELLVKGALESDGGVHLTHGERFRGLLVPFFGGMLRQTKQGFERMNEVVRQRLAGMKQPHTRMRRQMPQRSGAEQGILDVA